MDDFVEISCETLGEQTRFRPLHSGQVVGDFEDFALRELLLGDEGGLNSLLRIPLNCPTPQGEILRKLDVRSGLEYPIENRLSPWLFHHKVNTLYGFQETGVRFLVGRSRAILADDMGLGKTVQAIEAARSMVRSGACQRILVVCPRSLVFNWVIELQKWAPELAITPMMPTGAHAGNTWLRRVRRAHVFVTSYEQLRQNASAISNSFDLIIADEAHKLRNSGSGVSRAMRSMSSEFIWFLTGTPVERDSADLVTLLSLLEPRRFSSRDLKLTNSALSFRAKEFLLRRRKADVLKDLPEMTHVKLLLELSSQQRNTYEKLRLQAKLEPSLATFGKLREICDSDTVSGKSSKLDRVVELVREITVLGESIVIFSFWTRTLLLLKERLEAAGHKDLLFLSSDLSLVERQKTIQRFQEDGGILMASGHIAAEGLTLTAANHAIFLNQWWNPSINRQAEDRIRRIGQSKPTFAYTFTCRNTIEEAFIDMHNRKILTEAELIGSLVRSIEN